MPCRDAKHKSSSVEWSTRQPGIGVYGLGKWGAHQERTRASLGGFAAYHDSSCDVGVWGMHSQPSQIA